MRFLVMHEGKALAAYASLDAAESAVRDLHKGQKGVAVVSEMELDALRRWAVTHGADGADWKATLRRAWREGSFPLTNDADRATLRALHERKESRSTWLTRFELPAEPESPAVSEAEKRGREFVQRLIAVRGGTANDILAAESSIFDGNEDLADVVHDFDEAHPSPAAQRGRKYVRRVVEALGGNDGDQRAAEASVFDGQEHYPTGDEVLRRVRTCFNKTIAADACAEDEWRARAALAELGTYLDGLPGEARDDDQEESVVAKALRILRHDEAELRGLGVLRTYLDELFLRESGESTSSAALRLLRARADAAGVLADRVRGLEAEVARLKKLNKLGANFAEFLAEAMKGGGT